MKPQSARKIASIVLTIAMLLTLLPAVMPVSASAAAEHYVTTGQELATAINSVSNGGTIYLMNDIDAVSSSTRSSSSKSFTIEGNGYTISNSSSLANSTPIRFKEVGTITVRNVTFDGHRSSLKYGGGAIGIYEGSVRIENCTFVNNTASGSSYGGGAVLVQKGTTRIISSTFYNNNASGNHGGAIYGGSGGAIVNCTIVNNTARSNGGGIRGSSSLYVANSIVIGNTASSGTDMNTYRDGGYNLFGGVTGTSSSQSSTKTNQTNTGWLETGAPRDNGGLTKTIALVPAENSPAINKGTSATVNSVAVPAVDQRGNMRIGAPDIGAYEYALIEAEATIKVGEVYNLGAVTPLAKGMFETVEVVADTDWTDIIEFDPDTNERVKGLTAGEVLIQGFVGGSKFIEVTLTVAEDVTSNNVTNFEITACPEEAASEVWFDVLYDIAAEGNATHGVEVYVTQEDGSPLPANVKLMTPVKTDGKISLMLVNEPAGGEYNDIELAIRVKSAYDFTYYDTAEFTLRKPTDGAVVGVQLDSDKLQIDSEGAVTLSYETLSLGDITDDPTIVWSYTFSDGIAVQGLTQGMETDKQDGALVVEIKNRSGTTGTIKITATSKDNPYRSASVTISVLGVSNDVYTYDQLYQALLAASEGDVISIQADLTAKKVVMADGMTSASIKAASRSLQSTLTVKCGVTIEGNGHTIDGLGYYSIFYITSGETTIRNLTIENAYNYNTGKNERNGVAICIKGGDVTLENVTIFDSYCSVGAGGAVYLSDGGSAYIRNCTFANNKAVNGGGIYVDNGTLVLENTIVTANRADTQGDNLYYVAANAKNIEKIDGGYNIIYDIFSYGTSSSTRVDVTDTFPYNENDTTVNKNSIDAYSYEWLSTALGDNGGGARTLSLLYHEDSPAIDKIPEGLYPEFDQRGMRRVGLGDIGAYEYYGIAIDFTLARGDEVFIEDYYAADESAMLTLDGVTNWTSSNRSVAIMNNGYITAQREGSAVIQGRDGSGSVVVTANVYVGDNAIAGVSLDADRTDVDSGETAMLSYTVSAGESTDKGLAFSAELFDKNAWVQLSALPDTIEVIGLQSTTSAASGNMPLSIVNRSGKDAVIRITATSRANGAVAGTLDIVVAKETVRGVSLEVSAEEIVSGQPLTVKYALDASPSYEGALVWLNDFGSLVEQTLDNPTEMSGTIVLHPVSLSDEDLTLTLFLEETVSEKFAIANVTVTPAIEADAATSATIVNIAELRAAQPFDAADEIVTYYALSDDIAEGFTWTLYECDPEEHDDVFDLTVPVMVSVDGEEPFEYDGAFTTENATGSITFYIVGERYGEFMLVLDGASLPIIDNGDEMFDSVTVGFHYLFATEEYIPVTGVELSEVALNLQPENVVMLTATISPDDASDKTIVWSSSAPGVATVDADGKVTAIADGIATITAYAADGATDTCVVTVETPPEPVSATSVSLSANTLALTAGNNAMLTAVVSPADAANKAVTWSSSNAGVATVVNGRVTAVAAGTATITVKTDDGDFTATCVVTVTAASTSDNTGTGGGGGGGFGGSTGSSSNNDTEITESDTPLSEFTDGDAPLADAPVADMPFADVPESAWYYDAVKFAFDNGLFAGTSETTFSPGATMTRAMMVTVLYRLAGSPDSAAGAFTDVPSGTWYTDAVNWAASNGIVNGVGDGKFSPNSDITREQMAVILYNFAKATGVELPQVRELSDFADATAISAWADEAVKAMYAAGILSGKGEGAFDPQGKATRAEVATMFMNFVNAVE